MTPNEYLFPTRREFFRTASAAGVACAGLSLRAAEKKEPIKLGSGKATYTLDENWGKLPDGMKYGLGCALVVDSKDRVFVTSRSGNPCVAIFDTNGTLLETWDKQFAADVGFEKVDQVVATAHGLYWNKEGDQEFLYWTENVATPKGSPKIGARVYKTDMKGKVLYTLGNVEKEGATSQKFNLSNPTDVAVSANGDLYVVDGYGSQLLHRFDKNFKLIKTMGGPGNAHGKFNTCHGIWISTLRKEPEVYVADRANNRLEIFSLDLEYKRTVPGVRNPCCFYQHNGQLYIPELDARVTILDAEDKVVAQLGDGQAVKGEINKGPSHPDKFGFPHALTVASNGDLYVLEWVPYGRPRKFKHTPSA